MRREFGARLSNEELAAFEVLTEDYNGFHHVQRFLEGETTRCAAASRQHSCPAKLQLNLAT